MSNDKTPTLDLGKVKKGAKTRSSKGSDRRKHFHQWYAAKDEGGNAKLICRTDPGIPKAIDPKAGKAALIEFRFDISKGRHGGSLIMQDTAYFIAGEEEIPIKMYIECQAWDQKGQRQEDGEQYLSADADMFKLQIVATRGMFDVLAALPPEGLTDVKGNGQMVPCKTGATPWVSIHFRREGKCVNTSGSPSLGIQGVTPNPEDGYPGFERNALEAPLYSHIFVDNNEYWALRAVQMLEMEKGIRDIQVRFAVTPDLVGLLESHQDLFAGVTYEKTTQRRVVSYVK